MAVQRLCLLISDNGCWEEPFEFETCLRRLVFEAMEVRIDHQDRNNCPVAVGLESSVFSLAVRVVVCKSLPDTARPAFLV